MSDDRDRAPVEVEVVPFTAAATVPALLAGTDRLLVVPRLRLWEPVVYVALERDTGRALYVGLTTDLDARRLRHETEARKGDAEHVGGSAVPPGSLAVLNAEWAAVPVPAAHARRVEEALKRVLRPMLSPPWDGRLDARHAVALEAAGWTEAEAERIVREHRERPWRPGWMG